MLCKDMMLTLVFNCQKETTVEACARLMRDQGIGFVPVLESGRLVGVVTDRDLVVRVIADGQPATAPVGSVMSTGPFLVCRPDEPMEALERRMATEKKARAVVEDELGKVIGVISLSDLAQVEQFPARTGNLLRELTHRESAMVARR